jgi:hypothetical protein
LEAINNNQDYTNKLKNIIMRSLDAPYGPSKDKKAPKLTKRSLKMGNIRLYFVIITKV